MEKMDNLNEIKENDSDLKFKENPTIMDFKEPIKT